MMMPDDSANTDDGVKPKGKRRLRILQVIGNAIVGGMETYVGNLIANLPADEYDITCICPFESAFTASLRRLGCQVFITPISDDPPWRSIAMAVEIIRQHRIDLIHAHLLNAHTLAGIAGRLTNTPTVATVHSRSLWTQEISVSRLTETHLIFVCQEAYAQALATGLRVDKLTVIPNGVDTNRFKPDRSGAAFRQALGVPAHATLAGFVGRLSPEKGPDKFVQVAERIHQHMPDVHFALVGDGPLESELYELIERMGLAKRVHLAGARNDMESVYPAFDVLLQTSRSEAMPLVLLEAMACGLPVIAIAIGGVAEIVENGTSGQLISAGDWPGVASPYPGDWEGVASAAIDLLKRPDRLKQMGKVGRARAEELFDLKRNVLATGALFQRLVQPAVMKNGVWEPLPTVVRDKVDGERRVRLKAQAGGLEPGRPGLTAVRSVE
jgi:glycosyltransferase involved in cell wall biosynthesis